MIAMHYRFTLPADYDMALIEQRIASNGARLDGFPGLLFKAYLYSRQDDGALPGQENRYAPFYVWHSAEAMHRFLASEGFAALTRHFGWPRIETWHLLRSPDPASLDGACMARLRRTKVASHDQLADLRGLARDCNRYHLPRLYDELATLDRRNLVDPAWKAAIEGLLAGELKAPLAEGRALLVRLGRYGGAESKTLSGDGVAQIKIMQAKGMPPLYESRSRTVWLAAGHADRAHAALPFGWALVEIDPAAELPALRAWCEAQAARRPDMAARQARHAEARAVALAQQAARQAEREAAAAAEQQRLADEAERARRLASLSEALQEVESFADACRQREAQLRGNKDKPNTALHARAAQLATRAQAWAADEKAAAAAAIQHWIPLIVDIEPKELRKKLKLAALEPGA